MKKIIIVITLATVIFCFNIMPAAESIDAGSTTIPAAENSDAGSTTSPEVDKSASSTTSSAAGIVLLDSEKEYNIAQLQEMAINNSRQALVDDVDIKKKEMSVRTVRSDISAMSDSIRSITRPMEVELELEAARRTKQEHLNQLKAEVYNAAMSIQLCLKEIELKEQKLAIANEKLEMARVRFEAATITQDDLDSVQYDVDSCEVNLTGVKEKLNSLYLKLRGLLNQPLDAVPVKINVDIKLEAFKEIDIDDALNNLYKTETSVYRATGKLDVAKKAMEIASGLYRKGDLTYDNCALDLEEAELALLGAKSALDAKVKNMYNNMLNKLDNVELAEKYAVLTESKLANAKIKYDKGIISREAYMSAEEALLEAGYARLSAIIEFNIIKAEFTSMLGLD